MRTIRHFVVGSVAVIALGSTGALGGLMQQAHADPLSCPAGEDLDNGLCYQRCKAGFDRIGTTCLEKCKPGTRDGGKVCIPPAPLAATPKASYSLPPATPARNSRLLPAPSLTAKSIPAPIATPKATSTAAPSATPTASSTAAPTGTPTSPASGAPPSGHAFTSAEVSAILTALNNERAAPKTPAASTPIPALTWDSNLATTAQNFANTCTFGHNPSRATTGFSSVGETIYATTTPYSTATTPAQAVGAWVAEKSSYTYAAVSPANVAPTAQYTQVIWAATAKVGCAYATCSTGYKTIVICDYGNSGNFIGQPPYAAAP